MLTKPDKVDPLLIAKFHRPLLPEDCIHRPALLSKLQESDKRSLTLICAPAGYGKSSLAIEWLESVEYPSCWISMDQSDSDLRTFLRYIIKALQQHAPGFCNDLLAKINSVSLPSLLNLSTDFSNELESLDDRIVLALDDYHLIQNPDIHEFLSNLLGYPLPTLHLVIITRRNPPLPLTSLRASLRLNELRLRDLRFSEVESIEFLTKSNMKKLDAPLAAQIHNSTEGWAVGLRLALLATHHKVDLVGQLDRFDGDLYEIQQYLLSEVFNALPAQERDWLCKTSILDQFTAELCERLCLSTNGTSLKEVNGETFINKLHDGGLFCIDLDHRGDWHRYHHQFQYLLRERLETLYTLEEIQALHQTAAKWLEEYGDIERVLHHYLLSGDKELATLTILKNHQEAFSREEAYRVQHWLRIIGDTKLHNPELLLVQAWIAQKNTRYTELSEFLAQLDALLESTCDYPANELQRMLGECETLRCMLAYWNTDAKAAIAHADRALDLLPSANAARGFAALCKIGALQMQGETKKVEAFVQSLLEKKEYRQGAIQGRLLQGLCYTYTFSGDTSGLLRTCVSLEKLARDQQLPESLEYASYFRSMANYQLNNLPEALSDLKTIVSSKNMANFHNYTNSVCALCYTHMALGEENEALMLAESLVETTMGSGATGSIDMAQACLADLALRQNRLVEAVSWANAFETTLLKATTRFIMPELVYLKVRIFQNTSASRDEAAILVERLRAFLEKIHNVRFLAELQLLAALLLLRENRRDKAFAAIQGAVEQAQSGGYIRLFVDLGPELAPLLNQLQLDEFGLEYIGRVLSAFPVPSTASSKGGAYTIQALHDTGVTDAAAYALSEREQEILFLLAQRLNNKEIGQKLFISPATVKRHAHNIYEKLGVHSRREAVAKATGLGFIPAS